MREYLLSRSPWVDPAHTWDTMNAGDPESAVHAVGVGWLSSTSVPNSAIAAGCELFITHEALFRENAANERVQRRTEPRLTRRRILDQIGMVVPRVHDTWDPWPEIGNRDCFDSWLGLRRVIAKPDIYQGIHATEKSTLEDFGRHMALRVRPWASTALVSRVTSRWKSRDHLSGPVAPCPRQSIREWALTCCWSWSRPHHPRPCTFVE